MERAFQKQEVSGSVDRTREGYLALLFRRKVRLEVKVWTPACSIVESPGG